MARKKTARAKAPAPVIPAARQSTCECGKIIDIEVPVCPHCGIDYTEPDPLDDVRSRIKVIKAQLNSVFVEREEPIDAMVLAYLTRQHFLLVGGPGTAKTALVKRFLTHITGSRQFGVVLGKFTPPEKVFGPMDVKKFQEGIQCTQTKGKAADAEFVVADEYYKCSEACLNEMLGLMNERVFEDRPVPLMTMATITNWPELDARTEMVDALHDRILLRVAVPGPADEAAEIKMLDQVDAVRDYAPTTTITLAELKVAQQAVRTVTVSNDIRVAMVKLRRSLAPGVDQKGTPVDGVENSGRRMGQLQDVLRASAWLDGRDHVTVADFGSLQWGLWDKAADMAVVATKLALVDKVAVQEVVDAIDAGQAIIRAYNSGRKGAAQLNKCLIETAAAAKAARTLFERPVYTSAGRHTITRMYKSFKTDYATIVADANAAKQTAAKQTAAE